MKVNELGNSANLFKTQLNDNSTQKNSTSFNEVLTNSITELNRDQVQGYDAMEGIATGKVDNLQKAVQRIEEAELSMKLALEIKNKAISGFKEVMKMPV